MSEPLEPLAALGVRPRYNGFALYLSGARADIQGRPLRYWVDYWRRRLMIEEHLGLVKSIAKKYTNQGLPYNDLVQEGSIGLMKAVATFDRRRGCKLSTHATWEIRHAITRAIDNQARTIRIPVHMIEISNKLVRTSRQMLHEIGREPTPEELAEKLAMPLEKVREVLHLPKEPISIETPIGDEEDSHLGDFIPDTTVILTIEATQSNRRKAPARASDAKSKQAPVQQAYDPALLRRMQQVEWYQPNPLAFHGPRSLLPQATIDCQEGGEDACAQLALARRDGAPSPRCIDEADESLGFYGAFVGQPRRLQILWRVDANGQTKNRVAADLGIHRNTVLTELKTARAQYAERRLAAVAVRKPAGF